MIASARPRARHEPLAVGYPSAPESRWFCGLSAVCCIALRLCGIAEWRPIPTGLRVAVASLGTEVNVSDLLRMTGRVYRAAAPESAGAHCPGICRRSHGQAALAALRLA
jgi:hypothetical protein